MDGLDMYKGREINNRTDSVIGLAKIAKARKERKRAEKVRMIAEGNELANSNINLFAKESIHVSVTRTGGFTQVYDSVELMQFDYFQFVEVF